MIREVQLDPAAFDPLAVLSRLTAHRVEFVVIGGVAAVLRGAPVATVDLDAAVRRTADNLARTAAALAALDARVLVSVAPGGRTATIVDQEVTASMLDRLDPARLLTRHGAVDRVRASSCDRPTASGSSATSSDAVGVTP